MQEFRNILEILVLLGVLIVATTIPTTEETGIEDKWVKEKDLISEIIKSISTEKMTEYLSYFADKPHLAATPRDDELAEYIRDKFKEAGFDSSKLVPYNIYLSKPDPKNPNLVTLLKNGEKLFESQYKETPIHEGDDDPNFVDAFIAYTPAGTVSTEPGVGAVYVNYGRVEDFQKLEELGVNVSGHIAIVRYGKIFRGNKVNLAQKFGAKGIIIFSDPSEIAEEGIAPEDVYDKSWWLPGTGMQRGSTLVGFGDPLSPCWPSTEHAYRIPENEVDLPKIPGQPICYNDAKEILSRLGGDDAPKDWQGGLPGLTYKLGPFFNEKNNDVSLTLSTHNSAKVERSYNVIGIIKGSIEPDRYVLIGNHRDAWGYGAVDPSSGTVQLLESARVFGTLMKNGWRPRRTLVFCSWGAEEYGIIGSNEWVEENIDKLQSRAVAYINIDICTSGPALYIAASPLLFDVFPYITKLVPGIQDSSKTLFDEWKNYFQVLSSNVSEIPKIDGLGCGSDYAPFSAYGGIPAADITFGEDKIKYNVSIYPAFHTGYETFYMFSAFIDPGFKYTQGCGRLSSLVLKYLCDSSIIPYSLSPLPQFMSTTLKKSKNRDKLMEIYDKYVELENSVDRFAESIKQFENKLKNIAPDISPLKLRAINDQMMKLQQIFILPTGLPGRPMIRNTLMACSQFDDYASSGFPGLSDLLFDYDSLDEEMKVERNTLIKRHVSDLTIMTDRATSFLDEVYSI